MIVLRKTVHQVGFIYKNAPIDFRLFGGRLKLLSLARFLTTTKSIICIHVLYLYWLLC